nr:immunoglobulin light chain junction region [Macaca mulatta]MPO06173.1 immunoglobulin light chain junction region [Macaca mulatta]MPO06361.1 immunoglobulin light chain junction region [Macaca mulatta]MPO06983.1 immunoglobulin light chain junction region [Macaca mulatta]MPO07109.1 immunoglobulin light chain junction region [Macaca mulatta]
CSAWDSSLSTHSF